MVHKILESDFGKKNKILFALTGSSRRKLKRGGANLLAGRAIRFSLFPLSCFELENQFNLIECLKFGTLPKIFEFESEIEKIRYLKSYVENYIKEEILIEQLIRRLEPFRLFLILAARHNSEIINFSSVAKDVSVDSKTVENYYQILADTHLGFFLNAHGKSIRKVQILSPKFYFFDCGVKNALQKNLTLSLEPSSSEYGNCYETWFVNEVFKLNEYLETDFVLSYLRTKDGAEIDLVIEKPNQKILLIEIKSSTKIDDRHLRHLKNFKNDFLGADFICACEVDKPYEMDGIKVFPSLYALKFIFEGLI